MCLVFLVVTAPGYTPALLQRVSYKKKKERERLFYMSDIKIPSPDKLISSSFPFILSKILAFVQERTVFYDWELYKPTEGYSIIETPA